MKEGNFLKYNDYELIYYAKQKNDEAYEILVWKYSFLIKARIRKFKVPNSLWDDFYQECCLVLIKCIRNYDEKSKSTFTNYFDLILTRKIISLLRKSNKEKFKIIDDLDGLEDVDCREDCFFEDYDYGFSEFEYNVYGLSYIENLDVKEIAEKLNCDPRKVVNAKQRIIDKIKKHAKIV